MRLHGPLVSYPLPLFSHPIEFSLSWRYPLKPLLLGPLAAFFAGSTVLSAIPPLCEKYRHIIGAKKRNPPCVTKPMMTCMEWSGFIFGRRQEVEKKSQVSSWNNWAKGRTLKNWSSSPNVRRLFLASNVCMKCSLVTWNPCVRSPMQATVTAKHRETLSQFGNLFPHCAILHWGACVLP